MKRILAVLMILLLVGCAAVADTELDLSNMSAEELQQLIQNAEAALEQSMREEKIIADSLELVKQYWRDNCYAEEWYRQTEESRGYLEIINTRVAYIREILDVEDGIKDTAESIFGDVYCVVEFQMLSDYYGAAPYYSNTCRDNCVMVYRDGRMEVAGMPPFEMYRSRTYSIDFSGILESVKNFGSAYDAVYYLLEE